MGLRTHRKGEGRRVACSPSFLHQPITTSQIAVFFLLFCFSTKASLGEDRSLPPTGNQKRKGEFLESFCSHKFKKGNLNLHRDGDITPIRQLYSGSVPIARTSSRASFKSRQKSNDHPRHFSSVCHMQAPGDTDM